MMERTITIRIRGSWLRYLAVILASVLVAAPTAVWASHGFSDVPDTNTFHDDIDWLADSGVTLGCTGDASCPKDKVSREQMAAFMHRLAVNQVVDAASVEGMAVAEFSPRAAFDSSHVPPAINGTVLTTTITAPVDGILIMNAVLNPVRFGGTLNTVECSLRVDGSLVVGSFTDVSVGGADSTFETCDTGGGFVVAAGGHTVDFEVAQLSTGTTFDGGFLTVLFVPFDATGQTPTP